MLMGAWGVGPFENDDAADWALEFTDADLQAGLGIVRAARSNWQPRLTLPTTSTATWAPLPSLRLM